MTVHEIQQNPSDPGAEHDGSEDLYRIGTVANLTGIAVERLRAWERRYGLTPAHRTGKTRFYSRPQLERLTKLKQLSDNGHPISSIVELSDEQLDARLTSQRRPATGTAPKTGLIGPNLLVLEQQQEDVERIEVAARWANMAAFSSDQAAIGLLDVIVVQLPVLLDRQIERITEFCPGARIVAVYQFATPQQQSQVEARGVPTLSWPATWSDIEHAAASAALQSPQLRGDVQRRYSDEELIAIAVSAADDPSGCPQHLVELITQLNAFADYSEEFAATEADDPQTYEQIHLDVSHARAQLEMALEIAAEINSKQNLYKK